MKNGITIVLGILVFIVGISIFLFQWPGGFKSRVEIKSMGDGKGILVGDSNPQYKESDTTKWSPETRRRVEQHESDIKAIDEAHRFRVQAHGYLKEGKLELAAEAFEKAYAYKSHPFTGHAVTGFDLAETYEKLSRYDDAIAILDNMIKNHETNEYGIKKATEMRARLVSARDQSQ